MKRFRLPRRAVLRGAGVSLALPLLEPMVGPAHAQTAPPPRRLVGFYVPCGIRMATWTPVATGRDWALTPSLAPLANVKGKVLVLTGLANEPARPDGAGDHASGTGAFFTAAHPYKTEGSDIRNGISVDQAAAGYLKQFTRFPSLELGTSGGASSGGCDSGYSCAYARNIAWASDTQPLPKETNPSAAFTRLFGDVDAAATAQEAARRKAYRLSILDYVKGQATTLRPKLGKTDQRKLDEYFESVRSLEQRVQAVEAPTVCTGAPPSTSTDFRARTRAMLDLIVLAFRCDVTRVATFMLENAGSNRVFDFLGLTGGHHNYSHHAGAAESLDALSTIDKWEVEQLAYFLEQLEAVSEPDGTLLDNSLVFFSSEIEDGNSHSHYNMPIVVGGGGGGAVTPGRHVRYSGNPSVARLFLSLLSAVGVQRSSFGRTTAGTPAATTPLDSLKV